MALFRLGKKKEESTEQCSCSSNSCGCSGGCCSDAGQDQETSESRFIVLGACCKKSSDTFENTKIAVKELGFDEEVQNIGDAIEIAKYGVMQTPALVVDNKVVSYGKLLKVDDVKKLIENNLK